MLTRQRYFYYRIEPLVLSSVSPLRPKGSLVTKSTRPTGSLVIQSSEASLGLLIVHACRRLFIAHYIKQIIIRNVEKIIYDNYVLISWDEIMEFMLMHD